MSYVGHMILIRTVLIVAWQIVFSCSSHGSGERIIPDSSGLDALASAHFPLLIMQILVFADRDTPVFMHVSCLSAKLEPFQEFDCHW